MDSPGFIYIRPFWGYNSGVQYTNGGTMKLNNTLCKNAQPKDKPYKLSDGGGLYLLIKPNAAKHWRLKYRVSGKEKLLAIGPYPLISLLEARDAREVAKKQLLSGSDPMAVKRAKKDTNEANAKNTFKAVASEWHANQLDGWSAKYALNVQRRFDVDIFPYVGHVPMADVTAPILLDMIRKIEARGALDVATRVKQICGQICRYGVSTGKCDRDHAADLSGALKVGKVQHFAALSIKEMPEFLRVLASNDARLFAQTRRAMKILMFTFVRTNELINATWDEFDLDNARWEIPKQRMKMKRAHIVPLSKQVIKLLKEQREETKLLNSPYVFPSQKAPKAPMSNNTILFAIGRLGYKGKMTGHGFRALAMSTIKEDLGYRHEVVDRQLAHMHANKVDRAYDRAQFLDERKKMMQEWADYMDKVATKSEKNKK